MGAISPATQLCGIVLHPAGHTRSPAMHNAAFEALGIDARYLAFDVVPEGLAAAIAGARALGIRQLAISVPHKEAVMAHLDEIDPIAGRIGAVNTVTLRDGRLVGSNTDWLGALRALERQGPVRGKQAVVLGAGGTARATTFGLLEGGAEVTVLNRNVTRAETLCAELGASRSGPLSKLADLRCELLVNTTSVGMNEDLSPVPAGDLPRGAVVLDAVYQPEETRLLREASAAGCVAIGGKWMLISQAIEQIRIWTGRDAPAAAMERAFDRA